jgi:stage IV sporulation protein FA
MTFYDTDGVKRRREERVRRLREQMEDTYSSYFFEEEEDQLPYHMDRGRNEWQDERLSYPVRRKQSQVRPSTPMKSGEKWIIRIIVSFFLLSLAYVVQTVSFPGAEKYRGLMAEVLTRPYDFQGMAAWYEKKFGAIPTLMPPIGQAGNEVKPVLQSETSSLLLKAPAAGPVVKTFAEQGNGLYFTPAESAIKAVDHGWVTFAGEKEGIGKTVIIQHAKGMETWYGGLGIIDVKQNDWVEAQSPIGKPGTEQSKNKPVFFAVKKNEQFVNPQDVVGFGG